MSKLVCIVDDDELVRAKIAQDLKALGFDTVEVEDSRALPKVLSERPVEAVVVDLVMPEKDGVELIAEIRRGWPAVRIVAISGGGRIGPNLYLKIAQQMGASACLVKPVGAAALAEALNAA
ncbi:MAG TPA: response regulator [Caulobacteraceae bacterium]|jgi:CheY-like chemotaxis protein|nr:response regulator [Caulobacteraceae bacterium]